MKKLIRYFTLRKRIKLLLVKSVQKECELKKEYIKGFDLNYQFRNEMFKKEIDKQAAISELLRSLF